MSPLKLEHKLITCLSGQVDPCSPLLALPRPSYVTLAKLLGFFAYQYPHLY